MPIPSEDLLTTLGISLTNSSFVKLTLSAYTGTDPTLKRIDVRSVIIKRQPHLSFTYHHKTSDIVKNYSFEIGQKLVREYLEENFRAACLLTTEFDLLLENAAGRKASLKKKPATSRSVPTQNHDRAKERLLAATGQHYLYALKITDANGNVLKAAQDKYKQINKYIEILSGLLKSFPAHQPLHIIDMGAGKGYLTFALYDYLSRTMGSHIKITGVEYRADLVSLCNDIARESDFSGLNFVKGSIATFDASNANVLIALHACDTATDDAIFKGLSAEADLIVVAPCCHKQIRREMDKIAPPDEFEFMLRYGTFMERQAEMVTDALRALIMEYYGYSTKVFEFISDAHTPKNVMIVGSRNKGSSKNPAVLEKIRAAKTRFGITAHHLETLLDF